MSKEIKTYPLDVDLLEAILDFLPIGTIILDDAGLAGDARSLARGAEEQLS